MMIRGQYSDFFFETMLPALNAKVWSTYKAKPRLFDRLLDVESTSRSIEQFSQMTGLGLFTQVNEGGDTPTDKMLQGFDKTFKPVKFGLGIAASQELVEDDKIGLVSRRAVALANSANQTIEIQGASVFNKCKACHSDVANKNLVGPSLFGVVGRTAGTEAGYAYSAGLKALGYAWTEDKLEAWLANPKAVVPGTKMTFAGLPNAQDRDDVIAYLATKK